MVYVCVVCSLQMLTRQRNWDWKEAEGPRGERPNFTRLLHGHLVCTQSINAHRNLVSHDGSRQLAIGQASCIRAKEIRKRQTEDQEKKQQKVTHTVSYFIASSYFQKQTCFFFQVHFMKKPLNLSEASIFHENYRKPYSFISGESKGFELAVGSLCRFR